MTIRVPKSHLTCFAPAIVITLVGFVIAYHADFGRKLFLSPDIQLMSFRRA